VRILRGLAFLVGVLAAALVALLLGGRFLDGPLGPVTGGPLRSGELVAERSVDWSFARDLGELELQLASPPRSRTTWLLVHENHLYVPCSFDVPIPKRWPHQAERDGRAMVRVAGRRYERQAVRVTDPALHAELSRLLREKYGLGSEVSADPERLWFFRLDPRPVG
jgi:hypothetical protein